MYFIEFDSDGEFIRYGTGDQEPLISSDNVLVFVKDLPAPIEGVYYNLKTSSLARYTADEFASKTSHTKLDGTWSNLTMSWALMQDIPGQWDSVRQRRALGLQTSDWTQLPDVPLATREAWAAYRQALRDVTNQPDPFNIIWPTPPN